MSEAASLNVTGFRLFSDFGGAFGEGVFTQIYAGPTDKGEFVFSNSTLTDAS